MGDNSQPFIERPSDSVGLATLPLPLSPSPGPTVPDSVPPSLSPKVLTLCLTLCLDTDPDRVLNEGMTTNESTESTQSPCLRIGAHVRLLFGQTCGISEWLSCDECGAYWMGDPHADHICTNDRIVSPDLDPESTWDADIAAHAAIQSHR